MAPWSIERMDGAVCRALDLVLTDIDGTMTDTQGRIPSAAFAALEGARAAGMRTVVVTGRPAGWCDLIARTWPVDGVVGENGGLALWLDGDRMRREFLADEATRRQNRERLDAVARDVIAEVPGCAIAADQPYRELDLAVDFAEDVGPLDEAAIDAIVAVFQRHGAQAKVSSIHVNGWFGDYDKLGMCRRMARRWWDMDLDGDATAATFLGDSPNDEPMFAHFPHAIGVSNVRAFLHRMEHAPRYITPGAGAAGFAEALAHITAHREPPAARGGSFGIRVQNKRKW
jgi:HAD superfamily hydrolase (TIGR01484 family)